MIKYSAKEITNKFDKQFKELKERLEGKQTLRRPSGKIFEKIVRDSLIEELGNLRTPNPDELIEKQYPIIYELYNEKKSTKIDLKIGNKILVEVKGWGLDYGPDAVTKLGAIIKSAKEQKFQFLYITRRESDPKKEESKNYRADTIKLIGKENCFFLDDEEDNWQKFVNRVHSILKGDINSNYQKTKEIIKSLKQTETIFPDNI